MPTSDLAALSVHTFTTIIQLEQGMEKQFFIPKKSFYILRVISSLCAARARFFGRLRGLSQATEGGRVRVDAAATGSPSPSFPSQERLRAARLEVGSSAGKVQAEV